ncbi:MAG: bifunctional proline dehydrogenase/L-glutamate gamma-semialdehyde dehydrogenase PutA [Betaproteobacteria bacterium]|nr:bifunctional proline dehydrogenase/L-glutamate gamma-semialdehyde dehydrogenase PutA [Betaproteobacteria bacterium]
MKSDALQAARLIINQTYLTDETVLINNLLTHLSAYPANDIYACAHQLVAQVRKNKARESLTEAFLHEYQLNSDEGIVLMSLAEALLRIPDQATQDRFLADRLAAADWHKHLHHNDSFLVNLTTDVLQLSGQFEQRFTLQEPQCQHLVEKLLARLGQPLIRNALKQAIHLLGARFVMAETIDQAIIQSRQHPVYRYSFDMLGEAAITAEDAERYFQAYQRAIDQLATEAHCDTLFDNPNISVKLSALCPRYEPLQYQRAVPELIDKVVQLAIRARVGNISLTIDAEESDRLEMSLDIFNAVFLHPDLRNWPGLGLVVQAYQKRAYNVINWLAELAVTKQCQIPLRLVKGAYWDSEIKQAQENGLQNYPVFTRKSATDVSYLACAQLLLSRPEAFYPQFATHNAHTVAAIYHLGVAHPGYEFQRLHGMGEQLYQEIIERQPWHIPCRIYAPVGNYEDLLPYLVRRLLENGANTSFINQVEDPHVKIDEVIKEPITTWATWQKTKQISFPLPACLFGNNRVNSHGLNLADSLQRAKLQERLHELADKSYRAAPVVNGKVYAGEKHRKAAPYDQRETVGSVIYSEENAVADAVQSAALAFDNWRLCPVEERAAYLNKVADLMEQQRAELVSLCVREGGRTIKDALSEVREAVDFCRYYAACALELFNQPMKLPGPTGEDNQLRYYGRGVFLCISPWNFPIAIFTGQIAAALVAGNTVIAKPAERTALAAMACTLIFYQAGIPKSVLQFLPGQGSKIGRQLLMDTRISGIAGVAFTGSTQTAQLINKQLAEYQAIVPLIAETGGQNILIADSSAHKEQLVQDVIQSAFNSAGQRCSALRVLYLPLETSDEVIELLIGAMQQLIVGNPTEYATDVGPVISADAVQQLTQHCNRMQQEANILYQMQDNNNLDNGSFFPPSLIEIKDLGQLQEEIFGPVLHIIRYHTNDLGRVINSVNATGYGLTLGIHSRVRKTIQSIQQQVKVGNIYINRNIIGAVVGVQPFGGMGLSGTGPKAGGPDYLRRFVVEQTITNNIAAIGGNTGLLAQNLR